MHRLFCKCVVWKCFPLPWTISHSVHMLFVDTWVYFNSTNLDMFVLPASTTTDTDSILPCCLAFFTNVEPKGFWYIDRAHKNIAKCYNTDRSNFNPGFSITFALDSSQVSFALNVCRNELKSRCHVLVRPWRGCGESACRAVGASRSLWKAEEQNRLCLFRLRRKESGSDEDNRFTWSLR